MSSFLCISDIKKDILKLAWPLIIEQFLVMFVGLISTIFVAHIGKEAIAAVGMVNTVIYFLQTIFAGLSVGCTVIIARLIGENKKDNVKIALIQSLFIALIVALIITITGYFLSYSIIRFFLGNMGEKTLIIGLTYYKIIILGLPFMVFDIVIAGAQKGSGDTKTPMIVSAIVNIINIILSGILIFGVTIHDKTIINPLGIVGSALAVTIARISGGIMRFITLYINKGVLNISFKCKFTLDKQILKRILRIGFPAFLEQFIMQGGFLVMQKLIVSLGTTSAAVYQIGLSANSLANIPILGFSVAATTLVGQSLGKPDYRKAKKYADEATSLCLLITSLLSIIMIILARPVSYIYSNDLTVIKASIPVIRLFSMFQPFISIMLVCAGVLRASGDVMYIMLTAIIGLWLFRIFISYELNKHTSFALYSVMIGIGLDFSIRAAMYGLRMKAGKWKYLKV